MATDFHLIQRQLPTAAGSALQVLSSFRQALIQPQDFEDDIYETFSCMLFQSGKEGYDGYECLTFEIDFTSGEIKVLGSKGQFLFYVTGDIAEWRYLQLKMPEDHLQIGWLSFSSIFNAYDELVMCAKPSVGGEVDKYTIQMCAEGSHCLATIEHYVYEGVLLTVSDSLLNNYIYKAYILIAALRLAVVRFQISGRCLPISRTDWFSESPDVPEWATAKQDNLKTSTEVELPRWDHIEQNTLFLPNVKNFAIRKLATIEDMQSEFFLIIDSDNHRCKNRMEVITIADDTFLARVQDEINPDAILLNLQFSVKDIKAQHVVTFGDVDRTIASIDQLTATDARGHTLMKLKPTSNQRYEIYIGQMASVVGAIGFDILQGNTCVETYFDIHSADKAIALSLATILSFTEYGLRCCKVPEIKDVSCIYPLISSTLNSVNITKTHTHMACIENPEKSLENFRSSNTFFITAVTRASSSHVYLIASGESMRHLYTMEYRKHNESISLRDSLGSFVITAANNIGLWTDRSDIFVNGEWIGYILDNSIYDKDHKAMIKFTQNENDKRPSFTGKLPESHQPCSVEITCNESHVMQLRVDHDLSETLRITSIVFAMKVCMKFYQLYTVVARMTQLSLTPSVFHNMLLALESQFKAEVVGSSLTSSDWETLSKLENSKIVKFASNRDKDIDYLKLVNPDDKCLFFLAFNSSKGELKVMNSSTGRLIFQATNMIGLDSYIKVFDNKSSLIGSIGADKLYNEMGVECMYGEHTAADEDAAEDALFTLLSSEVIDQTMYEIQCHSKDKHIELLHSLESISQPDITRNILSICYAINVAYYASKLIEAPVAEVNTNADAIRLGNNYAAGLSLDDIDSSLYTELLSMDEYQLVQIAGSESNLCDDYKLLDSNKKELLFFGTGDPKNNTLEARSAKSNEVIFSMRGMTGSFSTDSPCHVFDSKSSLIGSTTAYSLLDERLDKFMNCLLEEITPSGKVFSLSYVGFEEKVVYIQSDSDEKTISIKMKDDSIPFKHRLLLLVYSIRLTDGRFGSLS